MANEYSLELPADPDLDVEYVAYERQCKGYLDAVIVIGGMRYHVTFYDPVRLAQTIESDLEASPVFLERNVIVIPSVTRAHMEAALERLACRPRSRRAIRTEVRREPRLRIFEVSHDNRCQSAISDEARGVPGHQLRVRRANTYVRIDYRPDHTAAGRPPRFRSPHVFGRQ
jgi:hypothetical protein